MKKLVKIVGGLVSARPSPHSFPRFFMKRFEQKVKDIVEVRSSPGLSDFLADPAQTLGGYLFTDITADLMAKWIGRIADVKNGRGAAFALAGFRGVGKSHFLAALSAIVSQPELRAKISDTHVMSTAQRLSRRHGLVAHVKRGSSHSLLDELKIGIAEVTGSGTGQLSDSLNEILLAAAKKGGDMPLVLLIDTAFGRETRVARDDGALLSDIAEAAVALGIFVGIALDDDIAGADGLNSSIASSFAIDYLDQEHLYKIVDAHVFPKHDQMRPVLHDIYESYRAAMPGFRWSEHRFSCLYPMHPAILELAPFVRLYLQEFALLGFAIEAGIRILGRPANSLIGLEEVFDSVETRLRSVHNLKDAFAAYDTLDRNVVSKAPVMKRHEAKLILKGLLLLSFSGEGVTATELSAAMLLFDDAKPGAGTENAAAMLEAFSDALPDSISKSESPDRETKFALKIGSGEDLNTVLAETVKHIPADAVEFALRRQTAEKFADFDISDDGSVIWASCHVVWRGGIRPGEIIWLSEDAPVPVAEEGSDNWKVFIRYGSSHASGDAAPDWPVCEWKLGEMTREDLDTIARFQVLQTDHELREDFRDAIPTALHAHSIAVEKIWQRVFLEESRLLSGESEYQFTEAARSSYNLAQMFTTMLEDQLEKQFPAHPVFPEMLGGKEVSVITEHLLSGSGSNDPEIQRLAANFALPLGLVGEQDGRYVPLAANDLVESTIIKDVVDLTGLDKNDVIPVSELSARMSAAPYGLTHEARHLVLAALVAQRQIEFVTSSGDRINHRSLDLQIIWEDIVGIARPTVESYSGERLTLWASLLTQDASLKGLKASEGRLKLIEAFSEWFAEWQKTNLVEKFDLLPDEKLNSKLWRIASNVKKTFGVVAESVESLLQDNITVDECLQTVADVFADSEDELESKQKDLAVLRDYIDRSAERDEMRRYLTLCEPTGDPEIEELRCSLIESISASYFDRRDAADDRINEDWARFKALYADLYAGKHDAAMANGQSSERLDEFFRTDLWTTFADLSSIQWFGRHDMEQAMTHIRELRNAECEADVREILAVQPFCDCSFTLTDSADADRLIEELGHTVAQGMDYFRHKLLEQRAEFSSALNEAAAKGHDDETLSKLTALPSFLETNRDFPQLSARDIHVLKVAAGGLDMSIPLHADRRRSAFETFGGLHPDDIRALENELDSLQELSRD